ncbi:MAG: hypothetical protein CMH27_00150 [Micavibrio sp.]|nr:hypothetical protein [Micavibrio sp.]
MDHNTIRYALNNSARIRAQNISDALENNGRFNEDGLTVKSWGQRYHLKIPTIDLTTQFNSKALYIQRANFITAFAPLVGAVIMEQFEEHRAKNNKERGRTDNEDKLTDRFEAVLENYYTKMQFHAFMDNHVIEGHYRGFASSGQAFIQIGTGGSYLFHVPFETNRLYEETITRQGDKQALFDFAKGYMKILHTLGPHGKYDRAEYIDIQDKVPEFKTACKALARITQAMKNKPEDELSPDDRAWQDASRFIDIPVKSEKSGGGFWQKIQNALSL